MKYKDFERALKSKYSDCNFYTHSNDEEIEIIYSNNKYLNDDEFLDSILEVAKDYFSEDELWNIVTTYDLYNQIPKYELELSKNQLEIQKVLCEIDKETQRIKCELELIDMSLMNIHKIPQRRIVGNLFTLISEKILDIGKEIILPVLNIDKEVSYGTCKSEYSRFVTMKI